MAEGNSNTVNIYMGSASSQIVAYVGTSPADPPPNPDAPAIAYPVSGGAPTFGWSVPDQAWK